jgi:hypothetical protein
LAFTILSIYMCGNTLLKEQFELPECGDAKNEKVGGENSIDQVLGEELE